MLPLSLILISLAWECVHVFTLELLKNHVTPVFIFQHLNMYTQIIFTPYQMFFSMTSVQLTFTWLTETKSSEKYISFS